MDVSQCLHKLGISADQLSGCGGDVKQEFTVIKKVPHLHRLLNNKGWYGGVSKNNGTIVSVT